MTQKCFKCKKEFKGRTWGTTSTFDLCKICEKREERKSITSWIVAIVVVLSIIFGIKYIYAKVVYNDARCIFAECRIIK